MKADRLMKVTAGVLIVGTLAACSGTSIEATSTPQPTEPERPPTHLPTDAPTATTQPTNVPTTVPESPTATQETLATETLEPAPLVTPVSEGKFILFSRNIHGNYDLFRLNLVTKAEENLTNTDDADEMNAQVSPDGSWAVFYGDHVTNDNPGGKNVLWKIDLKNNNNVSALTKGIDADGNIIDQHWYDPTISPDGKTIACKLDKGDENENGKIYLMDSDGENIRELLLKDEKGDLIHGEMWKPAFNADGTKIYITVGTRDDSEIYVVNSDGSNATRLTNNDNSDWYAAPNPTNKDEIAITSNESGHDQIYLMDSDGNIVQQLTDQPNDVDDPSWSPDGKQITAVENDGNQYDVIVIDRNGANLKNITNTPNKELSPAFIQ